MELLALALAPGIAIMWFIYSADKLEKEPLKALVLSFLLGMLAILPTLLLETAGVHLLDTFLPKEGWLYYSLLAFVVVAFTEELMKWTMVRLYAYKRTFFNEPFDGIVYGVMVSMGFATLENIGYVFQYGWQTGLLRMVLAVPAHATFGVLMGYYFGLARFVGKEREWGLKIRGLLLAVLFHGLYDLFLMAQQDNTITDSISSGLLFGTAALSFLVAVKLSWQAIKLHQQIALRNE
ncbi:MAG: PrsW family intramembrane metalloprotease [Flavipsychrobacter sp.]|nr:PrsW family intramembrane metalloprotease [Flavipsychrobacter sp.]